MTPTTESLRAGQLLTRPRLRLGASLGIPDGVLAGLLILVSVILSLAYVWLGCPLDLAPDEAHYWDWSRHLDWSYYSKGPLVAWLIRGSCELLGPLSVAVTGDSAAAVRFPACCFMLRSWPGCTCWPPGYSARRGSGSRWWRAALSCRLRGWVRCS